MAAPPESLRTHDRRAPFGQHLDQILERAPERLRAHVVGVATKSGALDPQVGGSAAEAAAPPAQFFQPPVVDSRFFERSPQGIAIEVRVAPRGWKAADVRHTLDPVTLEEREKVRPGHVGMADRPDASGLTLHLAVRTLSPRPGVVHRFRAAARALEATALIGLTFLAACGERGDDTAGGDRAASDDAQLVPSRAVPLDGTAEEPAFTPVELPRDFPAEFPIAPESAVIEALTREGSTGTWTTVTIVGRAEAETVAEWYREALEQAGWNVQAGASEPPSLVLHATRVDGYLDLATGPHPSHPRSGWVRTHAEIWMTHR